VGLEQGPLSLVGTTEELLDRNSIGSGLVSRESGREDSLHFPRHTLYPQKLAVTSQTSGGRLVGIVRSRTKATEFSLVLLGVVVMIITVSCSSCGDYNTEACHYFRAQQVEYFF
jgi:hypothetical protein